MKRVITAAAAICVMMADVSYAAADGCGAGEPADYVKECSVALRRNPNDAVNLERRGLAYTSLARHGDKKDFNLAIADMSKAIALKPKSGRYYESRGYVYQSMAREDGLAEGAKHALLNRALIDYNKSVEVEPSYARGFKSRGDLYVQDLKDAPHAIADYREALRLNPQEAGAKGMLESTLRMQAGQAN